MLNETVTETCYVLSRNAEHPYLSENGRNFTTLESDGSTYIPRAMRFPDMQSTVLYLRNNSNIPDVSNIVRVQSVVPKVTPVLRVEIVK